MSKSGTDPIDTDIQMPKELGGKGGTTNPEQLFAAGYAACFHQALKLVSQKHKADLSESTVQAKVGIGTNETGGYALTVELDVEMPHVPKQQAQEIIHAAHTVCPYSNATRNNIDVAINIT